MLKMSLSIIRPEMSVRNLQPDRNDIFISNNLFERNVKINTPLCQGYYKSRDKGQDAPACARCHLIRKLLYEKKVGSLESDFQIELFRKLIERYSFIEYIMVYCDQSSFGLSEKARANEKECLLYSIVYPVHPCKADADLLEVKLKEQFLLRKSLGIVDKNIARDQIYYRDNYHPVIMPASTTEKRETFGEDEGIILDVSNETFKIVDPEKAYKSGKYMHIINYYQACNILFGEVAPERIPIF
jgi:hypothetical protein